MTDFGPSRLYPDNGFQSSGDKFLQSPGWWYGFNFEPRDCLQSGLICLRPVNAEVVLILRLSQSEVSLYCIVSECDLCRSVLAARSSIAFLSEENLNLHKLEILFKHANQHTSAHRVRCLHWNLGIKTN